MADQTKKKAKKGGSYCVAGAPSDVSCKNNTYTTGVSMHYFLKNEAVCQKVDKVRPIWNMGVRSDPNFFVISKFFGDLKCMQKTWVLHMCEVLL